MTDCQNLDPSRTRSKDGLARILREMKKLLTDKYSQKSIQKNLFQLNYLWTKKFNNGLEFVTSLGGLSSIPANSFDVMYRLPQFYLSAVVTEFFYLSSVVTSQFSLYHI
jgi:hypothetical protein